MLLLLQLQLLFLLLRLRLIHRRHDPRSLGRGWHAVLKEAFDDADNCQCVRCASAGVDDEPLVTRRSAGTDQRRGSHQQAPDQSGVAFFA